MKSKAQLNSFFFPVVFIYNFFEQFLEIVGVGDTPAYSNIAGEYPPGVDGALLYAAGQRVVDGPELTPAFIAVQKANPNLLEIVRIFYCKLILFNSVLGTQGALVLQGCAEFEGNGPAPLKAPFELIVQLIFQRAVQLLARALFKQLVQLLGGLLQIDDVLLQNIIIINWNDGGVPIAEFQVDSVETLIFLLLEQIQNGLVDHKKTLEIENFQENLFKHFQLALVL